MHLYSSTTADRRHNETPVESIFLDWCSDISFWSGAWLEQKGLPAEPGRAAKAVHGDLPLELASAAAPVVPVGDDRFEIDLERGRMAVLQPVQDPEDGALADLIAWHPARPPRWRFLNGSGRLIGSINLEIEPAVVRVYPTPLAWVRGDRRGVCLLRRSVALDWRLRQADDLVIINDPGLADSLDQELRDPGPVPRVLVEMDMEIAA